MSSHDDSPRSEVILSAGGLVWRNSQNERQLAIVRRHGQTDWTLPYGRRAPDESWLCAAEREARNTIGCPVRVESFAGSTSDCKNGMPEVVLFWHMSAREEPNNEPAAKSADTDWVTADQAVERLSLTHERELLNRALTACDSVKGDLCAGSGARFDQALFSVLSNGRLRSNSHLRLRSDSSRRLANALTPYRIELAALIASQPVSSQMGKQSSSITSRTETEDGTDSQVSTGASWSDAAIDLLDQAELALESGNTELGWRCFKAATRFEIFGLASLANRSAFNARARQIHREASEKLGSWRKTVALELLEKENKLDPDVSAEQVFSAAQILHEHQDNMYFKIRFVERQLVVLTMIAAVLVGTWLVVAPIAALLNTSDGQLGSRELMVSVVLFGIMGAALSGLLSTAQGPDRQRIPEQLLHGRITLARLAMGAVAAVAVATFLISGLLELGTITSGLLLAAAFASGFSERLVRRTVEAVVR